VTAKLKLPIEPRLLGQDRAAAYCDLSIAAFTSVCPVKPIRIGTRKLYDRVQIDRWLDTYTTERPDSNEEILERLRNARAG
jgi:hypothetical protein